MIIDHLKANIKDLDADLSHSDRADLTAYRTLVQTILEPASLCTMWLEAESYSTYTQVLRQQCFHCLDANMSFLMAALASYSGNLHYRYIVQCLDMMQLSDMQARYGQGLPFPLCYILPRIQQFHVRQAFAHTTPEQVSQQAPLPVSLKMSVTAGSLCGCTEMFAVRSMPEHVSNTAACAAASQSSMVHTIT